MARYLARIANTRGYRPKNAHEIAESIRELFGTRESIGHLRVSTRAIEFDLFANEPEQLEDRKSLLESKIGRIVTLKALDLPFMPQAKQEILREGVQLFNEERYWECHEVLERIWHPSKGPERDVIQGLILTAAALVHAQKDEKETCLAMLKKGLSKLGTVGRYEGIDLDSVRGKVHTMLESGEPEPFKIELKHED